MEYIVKQASIENNEEIAKIFNEYRIFYKQNSNISGAKDFYLIVLNILNLLYL